MKRSDFLPFEEAREIARELGCKSQSQWFKYTGGDSFLCGIPVGPSQAYKNKGWVSWYDWLGTRQKKLWAFKKARAYVRKLGLKNQGEWHEWMEAEDPDFLPRNPRDAYKEWVNWMDWLDTHNVQGGSRKYTLNENYFKKWSSDMAYILGLWFADGCISGNSFSISLHRDDKYLLERVLEKMGSNQPLQLDNSRNSSALTVFSEIVVGYY